jgi:hypothetical protein
MNTFQNKADKPQPVQGIFSPGLAGDDWLTDSATRWFISEIQAARRGGYGFVPFIGAGFSAPSGAPIVRNLVHTCNVASSGR